MTRGRKEIPDQIKEQRGTLRKCRVNKNKPEVKPVSKMPPAPPYFNKQSKSVWHKLGKLLIDYGLINESNVISFELLCAEYGIYREAQESMGSIKNMIHTGIDARGNSISRVKAIRRISQNAFDNFRKQAVEFGLTPSTVSKVTIAKKEDKDPMRDYL